MHQESALLRSQRQSHRQQSGFLFPVNLLYRRRFQERRESSTSACCSDSAFRTSCVLISLRYRFLEAGRHWADSVWLSLRPILLQRLLLCIRVRSALQLITFLRQQGLISIVSCRDVMVLHGLCL